MIEKAEELVESKRHHAHYHLGCMALSIAPRLLHDQDYRGAFNAALFIVRMAWHETISGCAVAPHVIFTSGNGHR